MICVRKKCKKDDILIFDPKIGQIRYLWWKISQKTDSIRKSQSFQLKNSSTAENSFPIQKTMAADLL